jgi:hypothetical protein
MGITTAEKIIRVRELVEEIGNGQAAGLIDDVSDEELCELTGLIHDLDKAGALAEPVKSVDNKVTCAQAEAIAAQAMTYYNDAPRVIGLARPPEIMMDARLAAYDMTLSDGMVAVEFLRACTDERSRFEVIVYDARGGVVSSQDYG